MLVHVAKLFAQDNTVNFNTDYRKNNDNTVLIEIPEVQELTLIMMAITEKGLKDSNMVNHTSRYHQEVLNHFLPYKDHQAIKTFNALLDESLIYYILLSSNAYGFKFDGQQLKRTKVYNFPAKGVGTIEIEEDPIALYANEIEDFAKLSGFRTFYNNNQPYYKSIIADYEKYAAIDQQKKWLEGKFDYKINSYKVLTSGLIGGINATQTFESNGFKEMLLYLPVIKQHVDQTEDLNRALNARVIFTEIDHNYVGPLSESFQAKIDPVFSNRALWVDASNKSTNHYPNPIKVYDEYLTWGLFILYILDTEPKNTTLLNKVTAHVNDKMKQKGFPKSKEFNEELVRLYRINKNINFIYDGILDWSKGEE